ncbi:hypothetical protein JCM11641_006974 [Rhodosporidiobolus odoratus]
MPQSTNSTINTLNTSSFNFTPRKPCNQLTATVQRLSKSIFRPKSQTWLSPSPPLPLSASLSQRLDDFLSSPLAPPEVWTRFNRQTCGNPSVRRNANKLHSGANQKAWQGMDKHKVSEIRQELVGVLKKAEGDGMLEEWRKEGKKGTRGIVWTAGNADTFDRVLVSLRLLRHSYNTSLPATVFHFPTESPTSTQLSLFHSLNASVLALTQLDKDPQEGRTKSFHLKGAALVEAPYDEVLMLDSDSVPVRSVEGLWESREFQTMGVVLWPDYFKDQPENAIWSILGVQCRDEWTVEAGQVLIRKSQHLDALILVSHMLKSWKFWFAFSDGDKDLFRYALLLLRKRWAVPSLPLSPASWLDRSVLGPENHNKFAGHTMLQYGLASEAHARGQSGGGRVLFVHANLLKRIVGAHADISRFFLLTPYFLLISSISDIHNGNTWGRTLRLRLPLPFTTTNPAVSSSSSSLINATAPDHQDSSFIPTADHLANVSPFTGLGLGLASSLPPSAATQDAQVQVPPPPLWARSQALLSRGLRMNFWDGHRGSAYVLAVETRWEDELASSLVVSPPFAAAGEANQPEGKEKEEQEKEDVKPWEREGMDREEWEEWRDWVEREREAECTVDADVQGLAVPALPRAKATEGEGEEERIKVNEVVRRESLRSVLLSSSSSSMSRSTSTLGSSVLLAGGTGANPAAIAALADTDSKSDSNSQSGLDAISEGAGTVFEGVGDSRGTLNGWMEIALWADDPDLKDFEGKYYELGEGKAGGYGFRR